MLEILVGLDKCVEAAKVREQELAHLEKCYGKGDIKGPPVTGILRDNIVRLVCSLQNLYVIKKRLFVNKMHNKAYKHRLNKLL